MPKPLLKNLAAIEEIVKKERLSLFLDYDGTLTPITGRPDDAVLSFQMKEVLKALMRLYPTAIISGRSLADLKALVSIDGIVYGGNHGFEAWGRDFTMVFDPGDAIKKEISRLSEALRELPQKFRGVSVEDKGATLSIHYRLLDSRDKGFFMERFKEIATESIKKGLVRITESQKALEVRPGVDWHKGKAVEWMLDRKAFTDTYPVYLGDDETDKDSFRALRGKGVSIFVGGRSEEADYFLEFQNEVRIFLEWLCHAV